MNTKKVLKFALSIAILIGGVYMIEVVGAVACGVVMICYSCSIGKY